MLNTNLPGEPVGMICRSRRRQGCYRKPAIFPSAPKPRTNAARGIIRLGPPQEQITLDNVQGLLLNILVRWEKIGS